MSPWEWSTLGWASRAPLTKSEVVAVQASLWGTGVPEGPGSSIDSLWPQHGRWASDGREPARKSNWDRYSPPI